MGHEWTWGIVVFSIVGTIANIKKKRWCFIVWLFTNSAWLAYSIMTEQYSRAILDAIYLCFAVHGLIQWTLDDKKSKIGGNTMIDCNKLIETIDVKCDLCKREKAIFGLSSSEYSENAYGWFACETCLKDFLMATNKIKKHLGGNSDKK